MSDATWHRADVYYYEPDKDALILDAVRPLFDLLRPHVTGLHLARHWLRGPHLRLHVKAGPQTWTETLRPLVGTTIGEYLAAHPSAAVLDPEQELPQHVLLARCEAEEGPLTPWFPDNSVQYPPHDPRAHVFRSPEIGELVAEFATAATPVLFDMLDRVRSGDDDRALLALELMLAASASVHPPITASFASYRSHAEGFLHGCKDPAAVRTAFDEYYYANREVLVARVKAVLDALDGTGGPAPLAARWAALCQEYARRVDPLVRQNLVFPPTPVPNDASSGHMHPFHLMMFSSRAYRETVFEDPRFHRYRVLLNCTYLQNNRLGLTPYQRFRTCHAAANAIEDIYGLSAIDLIREFVESHPER